MPQKKFIPVFERTLSEQVEMIKPEIRKVQLDNIRRGLYNSYRDSSYTEKSILVRQYNDRKEVVKIDATTGHAQTIQIIR